ncbi:MAG: glucuronate isomerase [Oscillospiraceae bacterium]|nr:glucuronate isomerase [Oscillospiraceae bacterium]
MRAFMDKDFLLQSDTAKTLYHEHAAKMPIIDYHCHINPQEIMENVRFENITRAWLGGDHYKWRQMRTVGVSEEFITGNAPDREKFQKFCETMPLLIGNPIYHWSHLELRRYFDCDLVINGENAEAIWTLTGEKLKQDSFRARGIIAQSNVKAIGTTDDPVDDLEWHRALLEDPTNDVIVAPTMRPDKAINIDKPGFAAYIAKLADVSDVNIGTVEKLKAALLTRIALFDALGCRASDHGLGYVTYRRGDARMVEDIFQKGLAGEAVTEAEAEIFKTELMLFFGGEFARLGWVMQIHYGAQRNCNTAMLERLGPDTGFDAISTRDSGEAIVGFLDALAKTGRLPKTVLYSLNPNDNALLGTIIGCYQGDGVGKMQHGSAWWFNDTKRGMEEQMLMLASLGALGTFIGMLTDSRSFLSYPRHEYFRRILCNLIGDLVENGEYPWDKKALGALVEDISYRNAVRYFGFDLPL